MAEALSWREPPADLAHHVLGYVLRDERPAAEVVRSLPDVRASIQVMAAAPYWVKGRSPGATWRRLPEVTLWGPKYAWVYGFPGGHIRAFSVGLTAAGLCRVLQGPASQMVDQVLPLAEVSAPLATVLAPVPDDTFETWLARAEPALRGVFAGAPTADPLAAVLPILATAEESAVAAAAEAAGLSERQFRRLFRARHGVSPKLYQRAVRVDRMLRQLHPRPWEADDHAQHPIAFADQPHAIREFRALTGITPRQYLRAKAAGDRTLRSVPAPDVSPPVAD